MNKPIENLLKLQELEFGDFSGGGGVEAAISALRIKIPLPILAHYDRLIAQGKEGVAIVRHHVCAGCHIRIPIGAINTLMHGDDIRMCENCGRYLFLPSDERAEIMESSEPSQD